MRPGDEAGVVDGADAVIDGLLRELGRGGAPGDDESFIGRVMRATVPRRRAWASPLAMAAGLLLCVAGAWAWREWPQCQLLDVDGAVVRAHGWHPFAGVGPGDAVETAAGGHGVLVWADGSRVELGPASRVELPSCDETFSLRLGNGRIDAAIAPQPAGRPFVLRTGEAMVTVEGTAFTVTSGPSGTQISLRRGALRVSSPAGEARMLPGEAATVAPGRAPKLATASDAPVRFRESHRELGWTWRTTAATAAARFFDVDGTWIRVMSFAAADAPGTAMLPVPVLPPRWRAILQLRVRPHRGAAQVAIAAGEARLPIALAPGIWQRIHVLGDGQGVALAGSAARVALARPVDVLGVSLSGADVDIGEVVVLEEAP